MQDEAKRQKPSAIRKTNIDDLTYVLPESVSNVENGVGYFLGISSKTIPHRSCQNGNSTFIFLYYF